MLLTCCCVGGLVLTFVALYKAEAAVPVQQLTVHSKDIVFYDVALTSSARLCALSRDARWAEAYHNFTAPWTAASASLDHWDSDLAAEFAIATSAATAALSSMEVLALNACASDSSRSAQEGDVLFGADYEGNKSVRLDGIHSLKTAVSQRQQAFQSDDHSFNTASRVLVIISTFLVVVADFFAVAIAMWVESLTVSRAEDSQESSEQDFLLRALGLAAGADGSEGCGSASRAHLYRRVP